MHEGFICGLFHPLQFVEDLCTFDCAQRIITDMTSHGPRLHSKFDVSCSYLIRDCMFLMKQNQELG